MIFVQGHYSIVKASSWLGLGTSSVIKVRTDDKGKMDPAALDAAITEAKEKVTVLLFFRKFAIRWRFYV